MSKKTFFIIAICFIFCFVKTEVVFGQCLADGECSDFSDSTCWGVPFSISNCGVVTDCLGTRDCGDTCNISFSSDPNGLYPVTSWNICSNQIFYTRPQINRRPDGGYMSKLECHSEWDGYPSWKDYFMQFAVPPTGSYLYWFGLADLNAYYSYINSLDIQSSLWTHWYNHSFYYGYGGSCNYSGRMYCQAKNYSPDGSVYETCSGEIRLNSSPGTVKSHISANPNPTFDKSYDGRYYRANIYWGSENALYCSVNSDTPWQIGEYDWAENLNISNSLGGSVTYTFRSMPITVSISCTGSDGSVDTKSVTVTAGIPNPTLNFSASYN